MANNTNHRTARTPVRKEYKAIEWQQWFGRILVVIFVLGIISSTAYFKKVDTLPILHVTVDGEFSHTDRETLVKAVTPYAKGGFMSVDVAKIRQAGETLAWVKVVQVKRIWPDRLHLVVEEQAAIAQWGNEALVNENGHLFFPIKTSFPNGLVKLKGPKGSSQMLAKQLYEVRQIVTSLGMSVKKIDMNERRAWSIKLNNGLRVMLGRDQSEQRLKRFANVFATVLQPYKNDITVVDMRYTNGLSVAWTAGKKPDFNGTI